MAIVINSTTGEIDLDQTTPGTYVVTYTVQGVSSTQEVTVNAVDNAGFSYSASSYQPTDPDPTPTITGLTGGTFSAGSGLVFVDTGTNTGSSTGEIDLSASTATSYTITYNTSSSGSSVCPNTSTQTVEIDALVEQTANAETMSFNGTDQYVDNEIIDLGTNCTVSMWFKPATSSTDYVLLGSSSLGYNYLVRYMSPNLWVSAGGGAYLSFSIASNIVVNSWNYLAIEKTTDTVTMYLKNKNGDFSQSSTNSSISTLSLSFDRIGARSVNPASILFNGQIDEVAAFNKALSGAKIQQIYDATAVVDGIPQTANLFTGGLSSSLVYWNRMGDS